MEITLENTNLVEYHFEDGTSSLIGIVRGDSFKNIDIPSNPNPRGFTGKRNPNYKRMVHTLINEPHMFYHKNSSGITIFVEDYQLNDDNSVTLFLSECDGIGNGGHTYNALKTFGNDISYVKLIIEKNIDPLSMIGIVESLNLNKPIENNSLENKRGGFDWHKELLGELQNEVIYFEGDTGLVKMREHCGLLNIFLYDLKTSELDAERNFKYSMTSNAGMAQKMGKNDNIKQIESIMRDIHNFYMYVIKNDSYIEMCTMSKKSGWRRRFLNGEFGVSKTIALMLASGLAHVGTYLDENNALQWKQGFDTESLRESFADELFPKVFDILIVEEGAISAVCRTTDVVKRTILQAEFIAKFRGKK